MLANAQWDTGELSRTSYAKEYFKNGPTQGNAYEDAADAFADKKLKDFQDCLDKADKQCKKQK